MSAPSTGPLTARRPIVRFADRGLERGDDAVAVERPLEIRVDGRALVVTLSTPGHDRELALGFLAGEGLLTRAPDVAALSETRASCADQPDVVDIVLAPGVAFDWTRLERHFAATAACGLCGRAHLESLRAGLTAMAPGPQVDPRQITGLPERLREEQVAFAETGGLHAAAWCAPTAQGTLEPRVVREDVGRHNAVDKVAGWLVESGHYPAGSGVLWVSGRAGAEIVLKAARARIPILAAVGAPSSLAIQLAESAGMTLIGFLRGGRLTVYSGAERIG